MTFNLRLYGKVLLALTAYFCLSFQDVATAQNIRILDSFWNRPSQSYTWARIADPTGSAPTNRVERFALRDGHCRGTDCQASRARVERHIVTTLSDGDSLRYSYYVYFPSAEYNLVRGVSTTVGQLYLAGERGTSA